MKTRHFARGSALAPFLCLLVALSYSAPAHAQTSGIPDRTSKDPSQASERPVPVPGDIVRIERTNGSELSGTLVRLDARTLVISDRRDEEHVLDHEEVGGFWVGRKKTAAFAKGGALAGGLAVGAAGYAFAKAICEEPSCSDSSDARSGALMGAGIGVAGGAILGALIGSMVRGWQKVEGAPSGPEASWSLSVGPSGPGGDASAWSLGLTLSVAAPGSISTPR